MRRRNRRYFAVLAAFVSCSPAEAAPAPTGPRFNCQSPKSRAETLICADPDLTALDRQLVEALLNMSGQPLDQKALRADQDHWLLTIRNACATKTCLVAAYKKRIEVLLAQSAHVASPAASAETQPFAVDPKLMAEARTIVNGPCSFDMVTQDFSGFTLEPNWVPAVILKDHDVVIRRKGRSRFGFLFALTQGDKPSCKIVDVVALPVQGRVMSCTAISMELNGIGVRAKSSEPWAFWTVEAQAQKLIRQPLSVLGIPEKGANALSCRQPEWGE